MTDPDADESKIERLEKRIAELEKRQSRSALSRRSILAGVLGVGGLAAMGNVSAQQNQVGTIGTQNKRVDLFADNVAPRSIADDYLFAGEFSGGNATSRFNSCLSTASGGDRIYLESKNYDGTITVDKSVSLIGTTSGGLQGSEITGTLELTAQRPNVNNIINGGAININTSDVSLQSVYNRGTSTISISSSSCFVTFQKGAPDITLTSNSQSCIVALCKNPTVSDNGTGNIVSLNT